MRILHLMLANFYNEGYTYQENLLSDMNKKNGHDVKIIASTEVFVEGNQLGNIEPIRYINASGIEVVRLPYAKYLPHFLAKKIRKYDGLYGEIEQFNPDIIFMHSMQMLDLKTVVCYKKRYKNVILYADSHEDFNNSATNFLSKNILHKCFYLPIIKSALPYISKVLYISYETKIFLEALYHIKEDKLEYFPLGGIIYDEVTRNEKRNKIRAQYCLKSDDILIIHSGKMNEGKKTKELLQALSKVDNEKIKLIIIGRFDENYKKQVKSLIEADERVLYEGWKSGDELLEYLCACDLYAQPGSQSATMQNALCCECAVMVSTAKSHKYLLGDVAFYVEDIRDIVKVLTLISSDYSVLKLKKEEGFGLAQKKLDYVELAKKVENNSFSN